MSSLELHLDDYFAELGGVITGEIIRHPDADGLTSQSKARSVRISLGYETEGRGNTDRRSFDGPEFALESHGGVRARFEMPVPKVGSISYDGRLIRVWWELEARLDLKLARDEKVSTRVIIVPRHAGVLYERPHPLPISVQPT